MDDFGARPSDGAQRFAQEARKLLGAPFRLHGRDPETGLDCVGLVYCALRAADYPARMPQGYRIRGGDHAVYGAWADANGFCNMEPWAWSVAGNLVLCQPAKFQHHLMIADAGGFIHAHAGLGKTVFMPGPSIWPVIMQWRLAV